MMMMIKMGGCGLESSGSEWGPVTCYEHGNEHFGFISGWEFLD
jgi:hypothetical protein